MFPEDEVSNNEVLLQITVPAELIVGIACVFFETVIGTEAAVHPEPFVIVTENVPEFEAVILCVVAPEDHK